MRYNVRITIDGWGCLFIICGGTAFFFMISDAVARDWFPTIIWGIAWISFCIAGALLGEWRRVHKNSNGENNDI
jgi:hypothetical protein